MEENKGILSVLVYNKPGVLTKIAGLFTRRGFNIDSIAVGEGKEEGISRLTITVNDVKKEILEQIQKQLYKILEVIKVSKIDPVYKVERELALIKIKFNKNIKADVFQLINLFDGKIIDAGKDGVIVEVTGSSNKVESFIRLLDKNTIVEIVRSGNVAMDRLLKK